MRQLLRRRQDLVGGIAIFHGARLDLADVAVDFVGAVRRLFYVAADFCGCTALLDDGGGDCRGNAADVVDRLANTLDHGNRRAGGALNASDLLGDLVGCLGRLVGQVLDLLGDNGETLARLAGARRLDRRVQGQQIRLAGNVVDQIDDLGVGLAARVGACNAEDYPLGLDARACCLGRGPDGLELDGADAARVGQEPQAQGALVP